MRLTLPAPATRKTAKRMTSPPAGHTVSGGPSRLGNASPKGFHFYSTGLSGSLFPYVVTTKKNVCQRRQGVTTDCSRDRRWRLGDHPCRRSAIAVRHTRAPGSRGRDARGLVQTATTVGASRGRPTSRVRSAELCPGRGGLIQRIRSPTIPVRFMDGPLRSSERSTSIVPPSPRPAIKPVAPDYCSRSMLSLRCLMFATQFRSTAVSF